MARPDRTRRSGSQPRFSTLLLAACLSLLAITIGTITFLSRDLPEEPAPTLNFPATKFNFAFGSGNPTEDLMLVNEFANGYALLSSGPVSIQADKHRVLSYNWLPPKMPQEAAFFWRRADDPQNVSRTEITVPGTQLLNLSTESLWQGEITEFGFLIAGENGVPVGVGEASLIPDSLNIRLQLTWKAWTAFEVWSQQSINFIHGGDYRQIVALPLLVAAWLLCTLLLFWLFSRFGKTIETQQLLITAGIVFMIAWILLDIRWSANNLRQIQLSFQNQWQADDQQRSSEDLDGAIFQYVQRLKSNVLGDNNARILILGDENAIDYYLLRAKYHLLPHSSNVTGNFAKELAPESLDYVIFFGQPAGMVKAPGWNTTWQQALVRVDSGEWGAVYRVD